MVSPSAWQRLRAWLTRNGLTVVGTALLLLCLLAPLLLRRPPAPATPFPRPLSRKELRKADQAQAARLDSIRHESLKIARFVRVRDSALTAARRQNARAAYLLKPLTHETSRPTPAPAPQRLASSLAAYAPGTYALDSVTCIR